MRSGAGLQNKVLEAMFADKAVVTSPIGNEGIEGVHGKHLYLANDEHEYLRYIEEALNHKNCTTLNARGFIEKKFSVIKFVNHYEKILCNLCR